MQSYHSEVSIKLKVPVVLDDIEYLEMLAVLSRQDREVEVFFRDERLFSVLAPKNVFNPYNSSAACKTIELILTDIVDVKRKRVVDLGCGSGVIGIACIYKGCSHVLFTDINPNIRPLKQHPLLRPHDTVKVQDLCKHEPDESYDVVLALTPSIVVSTDKDITTNSVEGAILQKEGFTFRVISEASRVLAKGGELVVWLRNSHRKGIFPYHSIVLELHKHFNLSTMRILVYELAKELNQEKPNSDTPFVDSRIIFTIKK